MQNKRILFLGTHAQMNIGDELLLETFLNQLGAENLYYINSYDPAFTAAQLADRFQVEVFHTVKERSKLMRYLGRCDLLFFGGGSIIKELYPSTGRHPYSTLLMVLALVSAAKQLARKPIIMSNIGVGPLMSQRGHQLARWILHQVDVVTVRDEKSYETCRRLGVPPERLQLVPDAVFANPPSVFLDGVADKERPRSASDSPGLLKIALNLNYDIENPSNWETFRQNLADGLHLLAERHELEIHALPMQSHFKTMHDARVLDEFQALIPSLPFRRHAIQNHQDVARVLAECDILMGERLHALVIAAILGIPFYGLLYDVKVRELVKGLGMQAHAVDINRPFDPAVLAEGVETVLQRQEQIACHLQQRSSAFRQELQTYFASLEERLPRTVGR